MGGLDLLGEAEETDSELELVNSTQDGAGELAGIGDSTDEVFFATVRVFKLFHDIAERYICATATIPFPRAGRATLLGSLNA